MELMESLVWNKDVLVPSLYAQNSNYHPHPAGSIQLTLFPRFNFAMLSEEVGSADSFPPDLDELMIALPMPSRKHELVRRALWCARIQRIEVLSRLADEPEPRCSLQFPDSSISRADGQNRVQELRV